jgi:hypothetical protein
MSCPGLLQDCAGAPGQGLIGTAVAAAFRRIDANQPKPFAAVEPDRIAIGNVTDRGVAVDVIGTARGQRRRTGQPESGAGQVEKYARKSFFHGIPCRATLRCRSKPRFSQAELQGRETVPGSIAEGIGRYEHGQSGAEQAWHEALVF